MKVSVLRLKKPGQAVSTKANEKALMIDSKTNQRVVVMTDGNAGPYLTIPITEYDKLKQILDDAGIENSIDKGISDDDVRLDNIINFRKSADPQRIQAILDKLQ